MTDKQALILFMRLAGFKLDIVANRWRCDSELALVAHDILLDFISEMMDDLSRIMDLWNAMLAERDEYEQDAIAYDLRHYQTVFEEYWGRGETLFIGGWRISDESGRITNPLTRCDHVLADGELFVQDIPEQRLRGLASIIEAIEAESGASFQRATILYAKNPAYRSKRGGIEPFDPDAEIPW